MYISAAWVKVACGSIVKKIILNVAFENEEYTKEWSSEAWFY